MTSICPAVVRGRVMRITKLDACGVPVTGSASAVVTDGFISVAASPQYEGGDPIRVLNANGDLCINAKGKAQLAQEDLTITLCQINFDAFNLITGNPLVLDDTTPTPNTVGFRQRCGSSNTNFGLELWSEITNQACTTSTVQYYYSLWPLVSNAQYQDWTIENGAINMAVQASAFCNSGWGTGPWNVINTGVTPTPNKLLTAIGSNDLFHGQVTTLAPPSSACGVSALP